MYGTGYIQVTLKSQVIYLNNTEQLTNLLDICQSSVSIQRNLPDPDGNDIGLKVEVDN